MNITQKIMTMLILIVIIISTIMPTVHAVVEDVLQNGTEEQILYQQDKDSDKSQKDSRVFDTLLAGIFSNKEDVSEEKLKLSDVSSIILQKPTQSGIFIEENSRDYFLNLVNDVTNKTYKIDENGFLVEDLTISNDKIFNSNYSFYTNKIDELIASEKTLIVSINENYLQYNEATDEILSIIIEKDEYALLFKDSEENNKNDIIILNEYKYNEENSDNTSKFLMDKFLEVYYNEDEEFNKIVNTPSSTDIVENNKTEKEPVIENNIINEDVSTNEEIIMNEETFSDFDTILSSILYSTKDITLEDISNIENIRPSDCGIWVEANSREIFLNYLNTHSIYTYSLDDKGYLLCDKIMKNNTNIDFVDKTQIDIEIENMLKEDITYYVSITSSYLTKIENEIQNINLLDTEYVKTFDNEDFTNRIILLNNKYFNTNTGYNIELLDKFVKKIFDFNQGISLFSDTSKTGNMVSAQTVYAGPSDSDYATVGSVDPNEKVYILGQQSGWYHIQYHAGSVQKSGFVPKSTVYNLNVATSEIHEEIMTRWAKICKAKFKFTKL